MRLPQKFSPTSFTFFVMSAVLTSMLIAACGARKDFDQGEELAPAVLGGGGVSRVQSGQQVVTSAGGSTVTYVTKTIRRAKARPVFDIVPVTQIVEATSGISGWGSSALPFTGAPVLIGANVTDGQTPFTFDFDYPANNYQFTEAHVVIDTRRDTSDTEGIFVDGVMSGRPPTNMVNLSSTEITDNVYFGNGSGIENTNYIDFALAHYKRLTRNTFDLSLTDLLEQTSLTPKDVLSDGVLHVVTGDDSPVFQGYLVIKGLTIASSSLSCVNSNSFTFTNDYLHNDGDTTGVAAFQGSVGAPNTSFASPGTFPSLAFNFDAPLPKVAPNNITLSNAKLAVTAKKTGAEQAAIVINGVGISTSGFDRSTATAAVESWNDDATAAFQAFMTSVSTAAGGTSVQLDLLALLGAAGVRDLLAQGKLNIAVAGDLYFYGEAATSTRGFGVAVAGPELLLDGTYFAEVCNVPDDPDSPLGENGFVEPPIEYEDVQVQVASTEETEGSTTVVNDGEGPRLGSVQALDITSTSATIVWSTDEGSTSQVDYGIGQITTSTAVNTSRTTFHQVKLTGLIPYKFYKFQVLSKDKYGNASTSEIKLFTTLR